MFRVLAIVLLQALVASTYAHACENSKFNGFYVGVTAGFGKSEFGDIEVSDGLSSAIYDAEANGGVAGGYAGYNYQCGAAVFGIEGDILWSGMGGDETQSISGVDYALDVSTKYLASIRGRLGYDTGFALLYGTAGVGFTKAEAELSAAGTGLDSETETDAGLVFGGGIEGMVTETMSLRAEVLHYRFGDSDDGEYNPTTFRVGGA
ncbi:MAG: outer membrane beta-barrel protein, partial [Pseudomonadota bacterium]